MSALDLGRTQSWLATAIMSGSTIDAGVAVAEDVARGVRVEDVVAPGPRMSARERLRTYHHAYRWRLIECLADDYPALRHALEPSAFEQLCHDYIAEHPSPSFSLNFFGSKLPSFCRTRSEPWSHFAADLAVLEWSIVEAIHSPWSKISPRFVQVPADSWNTKRLVPSAALRIVRSRYPVNAYYQAFRDGRAPRDYPSPSPAVTAVVRNDLTIWRIDVPSSLVAAVNALVAGSTLGDALGTVSASEAEIGAAFRNWVGTGMFVDVE